MTILIDLICIIPIAMVLFLVVILRKKNTNHNELNKYPGNDAGYYRKVGK